MKVDVFKLKERYEKWKTEASEIGIEGLTKVNSDIILQHLTDMEQGRNTARSSKKGGRGYARLNNIRQRLSQLTHMLQNRGVNDISKLTDNQITKLFSDMDRGVIKTIKSEKYKSVGSYTNVLKSFWHWWMKVNRKKGIHIYDITEDIGTTTTTPKFVYLTKSDLEKLLPYFDENEQVMLMFMFDSIIRSPTELMSLRVNHVIEKDGEVWIGIPDEISKTFGRTFNLLYCGDALLNYILRNQLSDDDYLFKFSPGFMNRKLKRIAQQVFGEKVPHPKSEFYKNLSLYDFRHSGTINLRLLAKENPANISLDAIRHRGGWSDFKMLNYYTQYIGLDGKIDKQGMLMKQDKHRLEKEVDQLRKELKVNSKITKLILQMVAKGKSKKDVLQELQITSNKYSEFKIPIND